MISFVSLKDEDDSMEMLEFKYDNNQPQFMSEFEEDSIDYLGHNYSRPLLQGQHSNQDQIIPENISKKEEESFENLHFDKFEYCQCSLFPNEIAKMHAELHESQGDLLARISQISKVNRNNILKGKRIVSIEWNKQQKYIEVGYFKQASILVLGNESVKINCSDQSEIQAGPSLTEITTTQSLKHTKSNSITSTSSPAQIDEQCGISVSGKQKHITHHLDSSSLQSAFKDLSYQNSNIFCCSNYFQFPQEAQQASQVPMIQSTLINTEFLQFLTNQELSELSSTNNLALQLFPFDFQYFINFEKERKPFEIYQDIFKEVESFQEGHIACNDHLSFITKDGFIFTAQCLWQVFPFRDDNNQLLGCIIKKNVLVFDHMIEKIAQQRQSQINKDEQTQKQPQISSLIRNVLKLNVKPEQAAFNSEEELKQNFEKSVRNFLYKFKYIQKQKKTLPILDQDRYPSKTCKYRILASLKKSQSQK